MHSLLKAQSSLTVLYNVPAKKAISAARPDFKKNIETAIKAKGPTVQKLFNFAVKNAIANEKGCRLVDDPANRKYPMPLDTSDQDIVWVGRIRRDLINENGITLFCCGDQVRKGAATNAIQIAELFIER